MTVYGRAVRWDCGQHEAGDGEITRRREIEVIAWTEARPLNAAPQEGELPAQGDVLCGEV